jgi:hypothetical protein
VIIERSNVMRIRRQSLSAAILKVIAVSFAVSIGASIAMPVHAEVDPGGAARTVTIDGLEWALASNGENIKWPEAVEYCAGLSLAGHDDWRLPTLAELEGLHDADGEGGEGIRSPFVIGDCCLWSGESLVDRPAEDGDGIAGRPEMYHWGFMFDGGLPYYAVHIFDDGRALCTRDVGVAAE